MEKPKYNAFQNSWFMVGLAWREKKQSVLLFVVLVAVLEVAISLLGLFVAPSILEAIGEERPLGDFIGTVLRFVLPLLILKMGVAYCQGAEMWGKIDVRMAIVEAINEKFMTTSYANTLKEEVLKKKEQVIRLTHSNHDATEAVWLTLTNILQNGMGFLLYLALLTVRNPLIIGVVLATTVASFFINHRINGWGYRHREEEAAYDKQLGYIFYQSQNHSLAKEVRLFGMGDWLSSIYHKGMSLYRGFIARREKVYIWTDFIDLAFTVLRNGLAYWYLISLVLQDDLSVAAFLLYFTAFTNFTAWITNFLKEGATLQKQSLELSLIREFLDYPEPFRFEEGKPLPNADAYELELRNVSFKYEGAKDYTLKAINLTIPFGEKFAVVGVNGAGKTTLVKLICGYLDPTEGEVLLNGVDIRGYNRNDYYRLFATVFQDFSMMAGSIASNIAQQVEEVDMDKVKACAKKAGIDSVVQKLEAGFASNLEKWVHDEAVELSGGQTQRLMLARALYKDAPMLVLDEPTAALDPIAESEIYQKYNELTAGKTGIYISHRLASTGFCDRIVLLDGSEVAEMGTHGELLKLGGQYAEMFEIQGKYYQEEVGA